MTRRPARGRTGSPYPDQEQRTRDLANQGIIPLQAVNRDDIELERLISLGAVPAGPAQADADRSERRTIDLANQGLIPKQAVGRGGPQS